MCPHCIPRRHQVQGCMIPVTSGNVHRAWRADLGRDTDTTVQDGSDEDPD